MAELAVVSFKVEQTEEQTKLGTVYLEYAYTLTPNVEECRVGALFVMTVDILGADVLRDKVLVSGADAHRIVCEAGAPRRPIGGRREMIVGQHLLDEDLGSDEIKLRIVATPQKGPPLSIDTPVIRGDF